MKMLRIFFCAAMTLSSAGNLSAQVPLCLDGGSTIGKWQWFVSHNSINLISSLGREVEKLSLFSDYGMWNIGPAVGSPRDVKALRVSVDGKPVAQFEFAAYPQMRGPNYETLLAELSKGQMAQFEFTIKTANVKYDVSLADFKKAHDLAIKSLTRLQEQEKAGKCKKLSM